MMNTKHLDDRWDISDFYKKEFDFPLSSSDIVRRHYVIATSARSGSTLLSLLLYQRVGFGLPLEYFNFDKLAIRMAGTGSSTLEGYWEHVLATRTDNLSGLFGFKCFANFALTMSRSRPRMYEQHIRNASVIRLKRRNTIEQAVSMARALQTGRWFANRSEMASPRYDGDLIAKCLSRIELQDRWWDETLEGNGPEPISIYYEDLVSGTGHVFVTLASYLGVEDRGCREPLSPLPAIQRDFVNTDWIQRFASERGSLRHE